MITTDSDARITYLNPVAVSLTGWTQDDAFGKSLDSVFRIVNEETRAVVVNPAMRALREGVIVGLANHTVLIRRDDSELPIDDSAAPIKDASGRILGCVLVFRDITVRRAADVALRDSEERFRRLVEQVRDYAIYMLDPLGHVVSWNAGAERITQYTAEEIVGQHVSVLYPEQALREGRPTSGLETARTQGRWEDEGWRLRKGGAQFWANVIVTPVWDGTGVLRGFASVTRDLTERRRAAETLRSVLDHVIDGILTIDEQGVLQTVNPAAQRLFGYESDEIVGKNVKMLMPPPYRDEHDSYIANYLRTGQAKIIGSGREVQGRRKNGSTFPMELAVSAFELDGKRHFTGIVRDISERKRYEEALLAADRHKNEFMAILAHELRNPLAPVSNALQIMRLAGEDEATASHALGMAERQIGHMVRLVDDLLDVARISRGRIDLRKTDVELATVIRQAVEITRPMADLLRHQVSVTLPPEPIHLHADPVRLAQVFSNVLSNACKYTEPGGHVRLTAWREGSDAVVSVKDTGIGIPADMLPRVFDMFTQVHQTLERSQGGLGIGLTLVKQLLEMHGGTITANSAGPGHGSEFVLRLPLVVASHGVHHRGAARRHSYVIPRRRILVADDNRDNAESLATLLNISGHETRLAFDGLEAIQATAEFRPELVLLDIGMPGLNGYETCRSIRESEWGKNIVVVALTGWGQEEDRRKSEEAGFDHHMVKPVEYTALMKLLRESAQRSAPAES